MAKKAKAKTKRRKAPGTGSTGNTDPLDSATVPAMFRTTNEMPPEALAEANKGTISRVVDLLVKITASAKGFCVPFDLLGVPVNPTLIVETSGNRGMLDAKRPPVVENDDLLLFFDPDLGPGEYSFRLTLTYEHVLEPVTPLPLVDDKYAGVMEKRSARRHR